MKNSTTSLIPTVTWLLSATLFIVLSTSPVAAQFPEDTMPVEGIRAIELAKEHPCDLTSVHFVIPTGLTDADSVLPLRIVAQRNAVECGPIQVQIELNEESAFDELILFDGAQELELSLELPMPATVGDVPLVAALITESGGLTRRSMQVTVTSAAEQPFVVSDIDYI